MNIKFRNAHKPTYKIISSILALMLVVTGLGTWYGSSNADNEVEAVTDDQIARVDALENKVVMAADFYDYYYDDQITGSSNSTTYTQGETGGLSTQGSPYVQWREFIKQQDYLYPLYLGGYWIDYQIDDYADAGSYSKCYAQYSQIANLVDFSNFYWAFNLAQRTDKDNSEGDPDKVMNIAISGLVDENLKNGNIYTIDGKPLVYFDADSMKNEVITLTGISASGYTPNFSYNATKGYINTLTITGANNSNTVSFSSEKSDDKNTYLKVEFSGWTVLPSTVTVNYTSGTTSGTYTLNNSNGEFKLDISNSTFSKKALGDVTSVNNFPFYLNKTDSNSDGKIDSYVYEFDSTNSEHVVYIDKNTGKLSESHAKDSSSNVYAIANGYPTNESGYPESSNANGFYPFNKNTNTSSTAIKRAGYNYGFGAKFNIEFNVSDNGKDLLGNDQVFTFTGDDDVWIYVDDVLVLDMGGDHTTAKGTINFNTGDWTVETGVIEAYKVAGLTSDYGANGNANQLNASLKANSTVSSGNLSTIGNSGSNWWKGKDHVITMFYMERGMLESNLKLSFNFTPISNENALTVEEKTNFDNVNSALKAQTKTVADKDVFNYTISNAGTDAGDVDNSGIVFPTYSDINRVNTEASTTPTTTLASSTGVETTSKEYYVYFKPNDSWLAVWDGSQPGFGAYFYKGSENEFHMLESVGNNVYRIAVEMDSDLNPIYSNIIFVRIKPGETTLGTSWGNVGGQTADLSLPNPSGESAKYFYDMSSYSTTTGATDTYWTTSSTYPASIDNQITIYPTFGEKFVPNGTASTPLKNVAFVLTDPFASSELTGITNTNGVFNLLYGEAATFKSQFSEDSTMTVVQDANLYKITNNTLGKDEDDISKYHQSTYGTSGRTVSKYYNTTVKAVDKNDEAVNVTNNSTYKYANISDDTSAVQITQTFTNTVKVGDLIIEKTLKNPGETTETFKFILTLSELFGDTSGASVDISSLVYEVYDSTVTNYYGTTAKRTGTGSTIEIAANEVAVIKSIPVGTKYTISEQSNDYTPTFSNTEGYIVEDTYTTDTSGNITGATTNNTVSVSNDRKTNSLTIKKVVTGSGAVDGDTFTVAVVLTRPSGTNVDLRNYINTSNIQYNVGAALSSSSTNDSTEYTISFSVKKDSSVVIPNIPVGTTYKVTETIAQGYTPSYTPNQSGTITASTGTVTTQIVTITNTKKASTKASLTIEKYIDKLYYASDDNPHGFGDNYSFVKGNDTTNDVHGYEQYTQAEQSFIFKIEKYDSSKELVGTAYTVLKFPKMNSNANVTVDGTKYNYKALQKIQVEVGYTYVITEVTDGLSWRYEFKSDDIAVTNATAGGEAINVTSNTTALNGVSVTYSTTSANAQSATAKFYNARTTASQTIESDQSSITNHIKPES